MHGAKGCVPTFSLQLISPSAWCLVAAMMVSACDTGVVVGGKQAQTRINENGITRACVDTSNGIFICPASDMAKVTRTGDIPFEHSDLDWSDGPVQLHAARNETVAFQIIVKSDQAPEDNTISLSLSSMMNTGSTTSAAPDAFDQSMFTAFYHPIDNAGYTWGPATKVLPWPDQYPDALVPTQGTCGSANVQRNNKLTARIESGTNQAIWVDTFVAKKTAPGTYRQNVDIQIGENTLSLPIEINVYEASLPDETTIDAVGELYRPYLMEGAGFDLTQPLWQTIARCYQQMAHKHRMVFIERIAKPLSSEQIETYANIIDPAMTGELFTPEQGYIGPGTNTPVSIWRTPWPQTIDGANFNNITNDDIQNFEVLARQWHQLTTQRGWSVDNYFAYIYDEVDGPEISGYENITRDQYIELVHDQMAQVQESIDQGSASTNINLLWTSHSNPAIWQDNPLLDLTDTIRLWAPNASAADVDFLQRRVDAGEQAWFYHSGHPAIGAHSINATGIEMRTWGVVGARYNLTGQLMWAVNLGSNDFPFRDPQYRPDEDRAGNGVLVYPGNQLDKIGYAKSAGPIPSMRLKAWRRGLQDAELYFLAKSQSPERADQLINQQIPTALTEGRGAPSWSSNPADWINFHQQLLKLASGR